MVAGILGDILVPEWVTPTTVTQDAFHMGAAILDCTGTATPTFKCSLMGGSQGLPILIKETIMYSGYLFPYYRSWGFQQPQPYPFWSVGGVGINAIGSAFANQSLVNTGTMTAVTQTANPTVIW